MVRNPPEDAVDPHEWVRFFQDVVGASFVDGDDDGSGGGSGSGSGNADDNGGSSGDNGGSNGDRCKHVTCCTVVIDNKKLMKTLVERRGVLKSLDDTLELMTDEQYNQLGFNISIMKNTANANANANGTNNNNHGKDRPDPIVLNKGDIIVHMEQLKLIAERIRDQRQKQNCIMRGLGYVYRHIPLLGGGIPESYDQLVELDAEIVELTTGTSIGSDGSSGDDIVGRASDDNSDDNSNNNADSQAIQTTDKIIDYTDTCAPMNINGNVNGNVKTKQYNAAAIFLTFETEAFQRHVLRTMAVSSIALRSKKIKNPELLFRKGLGAGADDDNIGGGGGRGGGCGRGDIDNNVGYVLNAQEPAKPSTIRWQDQDITMTQKVVKWMLTVCVC